MRESCCGIIPQNAATLFALRKQSTRTKASTLRHALKNY